MHTSVDRGSDRRFTAREHDPPRECLSSTSHKAGVPGPQVSGGDGWRLVDVLLTGGAPWGFSLKGGLEYREPLIITKVEEGSQAWAVRLQVGDEVVAVNEFPLSGYRQEAIGLVKGSYKTLALGVRRRTETVNRPHSWHSAKFAVGQSEGWRRQTTGTAVSHSQYDASLSSDDLSRGWAQTNLRRVSHQSDSLGSMESLEHCPPLCPTGPLSQATPSGSMEYLGGAKRDSAYSSFSTGSRTPDHVLSRSNAASAENVACRAGAGAGACDSRSWQNLDEKQGAGHGEGWDAPRPPGPTPAGRASFGPIWHVPDKKRAADPSPPPPPAPPPPIRSDSFAVTTDHEKGPVVPCGERPDPYAEQWTPGQGRGAVRAPASASKGQQVDDRGPGVRWSYNPASTSEESIPPHRSGQSSQGGSRSSAELPLGHAPRQQQQCSDESATYPQPRVTVATGPANTGSYYSITQELPTDGLPQPSGHAWPPAGSADGTLHPDPGAEYYCVTAAPPPPAQDEDREGDMAGYGGVEATRGAKEPGQDSKSHKAKHRLSHPLPQRHQHNDHCEKQKGPPLEQLVAKPNGNERHSQGREDGYSAERRYVNFPLSQLEREEGQTLHRGPQQEGSHPQNNMDPAAGIPPYLPNPRTGQPGNERSATILRKEIQNRKAQLRKSQSTAALTGSSQAEEEEGGPEVSTETSASSSDGSFSSSYKDHLKEVQARVLQATSFRRRDLEPEAPAPPSTPAVVLHPQTPPPPGAAASLIGGRKRFLQEKNVLSISEPNRIHQVGVVRAEPALTPPEPARSLADRRKVFELTGKPVFQKPFLKQAKQGLPDSTHGRRTKGGARGGITPSRGQSEGQRASIGQERCTFVEYDAAWNVQWKSSEAKPAGRCLSADSVLDPAGDDRFRASCVHERSRSSPTTELNGQNILGSGRTSAEFSCPDQDPAGPEGAPSRVGEQRRGALGGKRSSSPLEGFSEPPPEGAVQDVPGCGGRGSALPLPRNPEVTPPHRESQSHRSAPGEAGPVAPRRRPQPRSERRRRSEGTPSPSPVPEENRRATLGSAEREPSPAPGSSSSSDPPPAPRSSSSFDPSGQLRPSTDRLRPPCPPVVPRRPASQPPASVLHDAPCSRMESPSESGGRVRKSPVPRPLPGQRTRETESCPPPDPAQEPRPPPDLAQEPCPLPDPAQELHPPPDPAPEPRPPPDPAQEPRPPPAWGQTEQTRAESQDGTYPGAPLEAPPPQPASTNGISPEEEQKREELARDIVGRDRSLADILDQSGMRTTMDLMEGIFPQGGGLTEGVFPLGGGLTEGPQQHRDPEPQQAPQEPRRSPERQEEDNMAAAVGMVTSSSYYFTSAPKAELLNKMKDMPGSVCEEEQEQEQDLACKKRQLIDSLTEKLQVLREVRESLLEDVRSSEALGEEVEACVEQACRPNELDKFRMFVGDLDKVVSLLLSLSGRLARVENALNTLQDDSTAEEKRTLTEKRALLVRQHEDAKELKENLDRRERLVSRILAGRLSEERLADFRHFVKMKAALIIEQRKLDDKIKLGEEQLKGLTDSLPPI